MFFFFDISAAQIRELRNQLRLTQSAFAHRLGVNQSTISKWENGANRPEGEEQQRLLRLWNEVFGGEPSKAQPSQPLPPPAAVSNRSSDNARPTDHRWAEQVGAIIEEELVAAGVVLSVSQRFELLATISRAVERIGELIKAGMAPEAAMHHVRKSIGEEDNVAG